MERFILNKLEQWKNSKYRKPLIIKGARQIGKTYIVKKFGEQFYEGIAYFNFEHDENLGELFKNTKDPKRILDQLSFLYGKSIIPGKTLIFFDEIQECSDALNSLKYFYEEANEYHIISAGSLLGIRLAQTSFPVGKVDFLNMYPMTFSEFLIADGSRNLVDYMKTIKGTEKIPEIFFNQLEEKLKAYFIVGGMPEAVNIWVKEKNMKLVNKIQENILQAYEQDFAKYVTANEANKISLIWNSIPSQLAKENKKFLYQTVKDGARAREYEGALNWLKNSNLIYKIYNVTKPNLPLKAYEDLTAFKIYMNDVGLLRKMANLDSKIVIEGDKLFKEFKGALTENYVLNALAYVLEGEINYYTWDRYEVDFLIQRKNEIIPIEVKSNRAINNISLTRYNEKMNNKFSIRFSMNNLEKNDKIINIPLFLIEYIDNIVF